MGKLDCPGEPNLKLSSGLKACVQHGDRSVDQNLGFLYDWFKFESIGCNIWQIEKKAFGHICIMNKMPNKPYIVISNLLVAKRFAKNIGDISVRLLIDHTFAVEYSHEQNGIFQIKFSTGKVWEWYFDRNTSISTTHIAECKIKKIRLWMSSGQCGKWMET